MHMYFNNMYGNTYIWVWTCILWYVLVLVLKLWNMYSSISISCSMCMVMFARVGVKTFMILYEPLWSCMILYDPLCVYRIIYIYCIHVRACYIHIYICPCDILLFRYPEDPFLAAKCDEAIGGQIRTCRIWWPIPCRTGHLNKSLPSSIYIYVII